MNATGIAGRVSSSTPATKPSFDLVVVDDDPAAIHLVQASLAHLSDRISVTGATTAEAAVRTVAARRPGLILLDLVMPGVQDFSLLETLKSESPGSDIILVTGHYSTDSAVEAIQKGACGYLTKPLPVERLLRTVLDWLEQAEVRAKAAELECRLAETFRFEGIIGRSPQILDLFAKIERIAPHFVNVLITGETGTGKELIARVLHRLSPVSEGPFVVCNSAAIAETLFESELFGHTRGSFTGAVADHKGLIEHAAGGTLFLDEIGEVPIAVQAKLLRLLQSREIQRIGDPRSRRIDVRIIAATNRDLAQMVTERTFREDLFYRLSTVQLRSPRLCDRREDVWLLAQYFLRHFGQVYGKPNLHLSRRTQNMIGRYRWPGNVRELENSINYCAMMAERDVVEPEDFPESVREGSDAPVRTAYWGEELLPLDEIEKRYVLHVLEQVKGNRMRAAEVLGIGRATLYRILNRMP
ncbi:MAG: sigma-54-dependent Fis family transcriptional regulator [Acidobacteria bacterium]|nr:sigma-54-dependent Fis family transcriptional regulator [Acidobacteriota bacterium]